MDMQKEKEHQLCLSSVRASPMNSFENLQGYSREMQILISSCSMQRPAFTRKILLRPQSYFQKKMVFSSKSLVSLRASSQPQVGTKIHFCTKQRLTAVLELPCLDTAAWYLANLSFMEVSVKRGISRLFLVSALSGLSAGLVSTECPGKENQTCEHRVTSSRLTEGLTNPLPPPPLGPQTFQIGRAQKCCNQSFTRRAINQKQRVHQHTERQKPLPLYCVIL